MNNCTENFATPEASTFSTSQSIGLMKMLDFCLHSFNFLFGLPLHSYVLWLIVTGTGDGVASEFFNLNLSVCEIVNCLNILVYVLDYWLLGLAITGRPLFQCLICVERYLALVHPVSFLKYKPLRYRVICSNFYIYIYFYLIQFIVFFSIHLYCLVAVLRALKQSGPGEKGRLRGRKEENHMKRRTFYLIRITSISMSIIYICHLLSQVYLLFFSHLFIVDIFSFVLFCFILAGFVQPVLYLHRAGKLSCPCSS